MSKGNGLFRQPDDWARDWGWVSRRRALNLAAKLDAIAEAIEGALDDEGGQIWASEIRKIKRSLAPKTVPAQRKMARAALLQKEEK